MKSKKILIDTNVFINAYFILDKKNHEIAKKIIFENSNKPNCYITTQNLNEFINYCINSKLSKKDINIFINELTTLFNILDCSETIVSSSIDLVFSRKLNFFDALFIQNAIDNKIDIIYSNKLLSKKKFKGIKIINPFK